MEIDITALRHVDVWQFSHSQAENGFTGNAGKETWQAALNAGLEPPLLNAPEAIAEFRDYVRDFGAWDDEEITAWNENECNALFLQFVSGDIREAGADCLHDVNWRAYERDATSGRISGRMSRQTFGRGKPAKFWYYIGN